MKSRKISLLMTYVILSLIAIFSLIPILWALVASFNPASSLFERSILKMGNFTLNNYTRLFTEIAFSRWFFNSSFVAIFSCLLTLFFCSLGGYAFAKYDFAGKNVLFLVAIASMTIPVWTTMVPLFRWFVQLGLIDTYWALILPQSANPLGIFLMRQYIQGVPSEMIDSARIDGCSDFQIYYRMILPVIKPALGALGIWAFMFSWNDFISALVFIRSPELFTIPVGLASFIGQENPQFDLLMAGGMISLVPVLVFFLAAQKQFVAGLTLGAVKG